MKDGRLIVLVVEDSLMIIERIFSLLEESDNIKLVVHAANYAESIKMVNEVNADVVLLDINLPDKSGIELLQEIKSSHPDMKVVMLTNHASQNYKEICMHMGADYFLDKSIDFEKIPDVIRTLN
jgi:DNA-binding NarL/FixJ family response regulator